MKRLRFFIILLVILLLPAAQLALAWPGEPFARIDLSGPGLKGVAQITDPALLGSMTIESFNDFSEFIDEPANLGEGYTLHRYFKNEDGSWFDFDQVRYYPDPAGGPGYVFYEAGFGYSPVHNAGKWFRATPEAQRQMTQTLASIGASLVVSGESSTAAETAPLTSASASQPLIWVAVLAGVLLVSGGVLALRRQET